MYGTYVSVKIHSENLRIFMNWNLEPTIQS